MSLLSGFGSVIQHVNPKRQYRKKKLKHLGLKNMKQFRKWDKLRRRKEREKLQIGLVKE